MKNTKTILSWSLVLLWMTAIFYLSSQPATQSDQLSKHVAEVVLEKVEQVTPNINLNLGRLNYLVRKNAHFFSYFILGILVFNAISQGKPPGFGRIGLTLFICVIYAISDEIHQLFVPGRAGQVKDVLIDSAGAFTGITLYYLISTTIKKVRAA